MTPDLRLAALRLVDILARENHALSVLDLAQAAELVSEKLAATDAFLRLRSVAPVAPTPEAVAVSTQLETLAQQNRALLERAMEVQQRVLATIRRAVLRPATGARYGAGGHGAPSTPAPVAISAQA